MSDSLSDIGEGFWRGWPQRRTLNADSVDQRAPFMVEWNPAAPAKTNLTDNWRSTVWSTSATWSLPEPLPRPSAGLLASPSASRGVRYIDEKLSKADKSVFLKLSATYRYRKMEILNLSKNYRYQKMHQIWSDKYMKSQSIRN